MSSRELAPNTCRGDELKLATETISERFARVGAAKNYQAALDFLRTPARYIDLGQACERHGLAWFAEGGEMLFQAPDDVIAEQAVESYIAAQWQPMASAPRDGTWFLACATKPGWAATRLVRFGDPADRLPTHGEGNVWPSEPTHWMPLPEGPK